MTYTLGSIEAVIDKIDARLLAHVTSGVLTDLKNVYIGDRPNSYDKEAMPNIVINVITGSARSMMTAYSAGQNSFTLPIEIRIFQTKILEENTVSYARNVLFDSAGKGIIALMQNVIYALTYETDGTFKPEFGLQLDAMPMPNFYLDQHEDFNELILTFTVDKRYAYSAIKGT